MNDIRDTRYTTWRPTNYSEFYGRTLFDGEKLRTGTSRPSAFGRLSHRLEDLPPAFDARDKWGGKVSGIRDQGIF